MVIQDFEFHLDSFRLHVGPPLHTAGVRHLQRGRGGFLIDDREAGPAAAPLHYSCQSLGTIPVPLHGGLAIHVTNTAERYDFEGEEIFPSDQLDWSRLWAQSRISHSTAAKVLASYLPIQPRLLFSGVWTTKTGWRG
jgi:hypothetical protein